MSSEASTLPLGRERLLRRLLPGARARDGTAAAPAVAAVALTAIVLLSLFVVVMAADRPSLLSPILSVASGRG